MSITQVTIGHDGEQTSTELPTSGEVSRSTDWQGGGVTVQEGFGSRTVYNPADLEDHHLITVGKGTDSMQLQVRHAREMGLLDAVFAPVEANRTPTEQLEAAAKAAPTPEAPTEGSFEEAEANLNAAVEAGTMDHVEANAVATALGEAALTGWNLEQTQEIVEGLRTGTIDATDLSTNERHVAEAVESKVTDAQTASARSELGSEAFNHLQQIAQSNPDVSEAIRGYGMQRAQGRADATWGEFYSDVMAHIEGR